uniref:Uncharacterized protein n=1 Tax=Anopheles quadriannulatus TaxID=34691 RepID=A0A182XRF7_ANOQN
PVHGCAYIVRFPEAPSFRPNRSDVTDAFQCDLPAATECVCELRTGKRRLRSGSEAKGIRLGTSACAAVRSLTLRSDWLAGAFLTQLLQQYSIPCKCVT